MKRKYLESGILEKWHDKTFEDFTNDDYALKQVKHCVENIDAMYKDGVGVFLWGSNGVGKSLLMNVAFKEIMKKVKKSSSSTIKHYTTKIITLSTLVTTYTNSWYNKEDAHFLDEVKNVDFLGIEEIGKEFKSATDLGSVVLDTIVKYRVQRMLPIWATTNLEPSNVVGYYTEDIASMLREAVLAVQVTGKDMRVSIQKEIKRKYSI